MLYCGRNNGWIDLSEGNDLSKSNNKKRMYSLSPLIV